ncbi:MAG: hypothetical protein HRU13_00760 [Phycisphaerales bacterium]|nr:hypothetical protein [Phycisphaerales bacterium]
MAFLQASRVASASLVALVAASAAQGQVIESRWITAVSGDWTDAARWSTPEFPTARGQDEYRAIIDVVGSPYTISLSTDIDLSELVYTSADATIDGAGVGTIVVRDDLEFGDATVRAVAELMAEGTLRFTGDVVSEIDDTPLCLPGLASARKTGMGDILLSGTGLIEISSGATFTIENSGDFVGDSTARLINDGIFTKDSPGLTLIEDIAFENNGTVVVQQGALEVTDPVLPALGVLGPATYEIEAGAVLDFSGTTLSTNQADVFFNGPDASFSQLSGVDLNEGLVLAAGGASVPFSGAGAFTNEGDLAALGPGSIISTVGSVVNTSSGALTVDGGGRIVTGGVGVVNEGLAQGVGTIVAQTFVNNGVVSPGSSPGILVTESASGANHVFEQTGSGTLLIEIEGRTAGLTHDVLEVRGIALFNGSLQLDFAPFSGEPPIQTGDQFQIIMADGIDGVFTDIDVNGLGAAGSVDVFLNPNGVLVVVTQIPSPGALAVLGLGGLAAMRRRR